MFSLEIEVDDSWLSSVYDHVHHGRMLSMFEQARLGLVEAIGFPNDELLRQGKFIVVTRAEVAYKREVKRGRVSVTCDGVKMDGRTFRIRPRIINHRGKVAVEAEVSLMFMDGATRLGVLPPEDFAAALTAKLTAA
jgi:acyl-CoA thioesterase FadM